MSRKKLVSNLLHGKKYSIFQDAKADKTTGATQRLSNLYTGKRLNPGVMGTLAGGYLVSKAGVETTKDTLFGEMDLATRNYIGSGPADIMNYDGVDRRSSTPKDLNATGDIVFGLHNQRRG